MRWRGWLLLLLLLAGVPLSLLWAVPGNSLYLGQLSRQYAALPHPPSSMALQTYQAVGVLDGAGNHCDFIAGEQRQSALSPEAVQAFYADMPRVWVYHPALPEGEANYAPDHLRHHTTDGWPVGSYAVYLYSGPHDPSGDPRCH